MTRIRTIALTVWLEMLRRKDIYVLLILMGVLLFALVSIEIFGLAGVTAYVKDIGLLFTWLFGWILAVSVTARELPNEEKRGTVYSLLAKPITRVELVMGKWLGCWSIVSAATFCFYCAVIGVVLLADGTFRYDVLVQGYLLHTGALAILCAVAMALSTRMNFDAAATFTFAVTGSAFLLLPRIPHLMTHEKGVRETALLILYYALPHFELFDMRQRLVHETTPVSWAVFGRICLYGILMTAVFVLLAWVSYRNKKFSREAAI